MGYIQDRINAKVPKALDGKLSDATESFEAKRTTYGEYVPGQGSSETTETWAGRWIKGKWSIDEIDDQHLLRTDLKRTVVRIETDWVPAIDDKANGYDVINVGEDPASTLWILQLRKSGG